MLVGLEPSDSYSEEETNWPSDYESYYDEATNRDIHGFLFYDTDSSGSSFINRSFIDTLKGEIYYTNSQKCGTPPNQEARRNCVTHLSMQIEAIDPDVVISLGKRSTDALRAKIGDFEFSPYDNYYELVLHRYRANSGRTIIPSYHWSYFDRSDDPIPHHLQTDHDIQNVEHYWETVAKLSNIILNER